MCAWLAALMVGRASDSPRIVSDPVVPDIIKAPPTDSFSLSVTAKGVQIYECRAKKDDPAQFEWAFKGPEADLFDARGRKVGKHYAESGPVWESDDGSKVFGQVNQRADSPDATAIQWLLLKAIKNEGHGMFSNVASIQRVKTAGGRAPAGGCDQTSVGRELRVPYTAAYYFYTPKP